MTHKVAAPIALALITPIALWAEGQVCAQGHVHEKTAPYISAHTDVRIHADQVYDADHEEDEIFNLSTHSHTDLEFSPLEDLFVRSSLKLEQKHSHSHDGGAAHESDGKDKYFDDHILLIEQLKLVYTPDQWELFAGKFNPTAGLNQHDIPGYYGYAIEEEYSILGRIGAGSAYTFETLSMGDHKLEASGFFRDTTVLSEGIMNDSDEPHDLNDGGLANTEDFSSGAISLSGDIFYFPIGDTIHEIDYVAALAHQNAGHGAEAGHDDEDRAVLAGIYKAALTTDLR
ncbi:MAG: hypothetical protein FJ220_06120, partial [Kiritimatiellaceae bacterium]|nr:hypothetical protein [Kiritimatiellaceae bacterium]